MIGFHSLHTIMLIGSPVLLRQHLKGDGGAAVVTLQFALTGVENAAHW